MKIISISVPCVSAKGHLVMLKAKGRLPGRMGASGAGCSFAGHAELRRQKAVWDREPSRQGAACRLFFLTALHHTYVNCTVIAR